MSKAGYEKLQTTLIQLSLRDPDSLKMYTYHDYVGYGVMEMVEICCWISTKPKAIGKSSGLAARSQQCHSCVASACRCTCWSFHLVKGLSIGRNDKFQKQGVDDSEMVGNLCNLVGTMFLTMLATLERHNLLKPDSEIKSLALIMALYIRVVRQLFAVNAFDDLDTRVLAYADKHKIAVRDVPGMRRDVDNLQAKADKVELPEFKVRDTIRGSGGAASKTIRTRLRTCRTMRSSRT